MYWGLEATDEAAERLADVVICWVLRLRFLGSGFRALWLQSWGVVPSAFALSGFVAWGLGCKLEPCAVAPGTKEFRFSDLKPKP